MFCYQKPIYPVTQENETYLGSKIFLQLDTWPACLLVFCDLVCDYQWFPNVLHDFLFLFFDLQVGGLRVWGCIFLYPMFDTAYRCLLVLPFPSNWVLFTCNIFVRNLSQCKEICWIAPSIESGLPTAGKSLRCTRSWSWTLFFLEGCSSCEGFESSIIIFSMVCMSHSMSVMQSNGH